MGPSTLISALQRRQKVLVLAFTAFVLLVVAALQFASLWWRRERLLRDAELRASNLSFILAEYVHGVFTLADTSLRQLAVHASHAGGADAPAEVWDPILSAARAAVPASGSLSVTDAQGIIRRSTQPAIVGQSRKDNYLFKQLVRSDADELVVDRPFLSPLEPQRFLIPIGRRLLDENGKFAGAVVAVVMPEAFRKFFRTVDVGESGMISVFHPDGVVLFREPSVKDPIGESASQSPLLVGAQRDVERGMIRGALVPDGPVYLSAFQRILGTPPLIVAVSLNETDILADWYRQLNTSLTAFVALMLTIALMIRVLFRQIDARAKVEKELGEVQLAEAARLRESNERLAEALDREQRARRETEAASYSKDEFLMTVSHELRTPLTAIYGWVRMLASAGLPEAQRTRAVAAIERNVRVQTRLIDDLLDVSRVISGKLRLDARPVNIAEVLISAAETLRPALEAKGITFESDIDTSIGQVVVDPVRVQQIVWNLLSNATKFTPEGGRVWLSLVRRESTIEISVSDTGVGIDADFLPLVFERFRQADAGSRRRYGGLGLGLAIVRHLAELHGGSVTAESGGDGKGATFRVQLPVRTLRPDVQPGTLLTRTPSVDVERT